MSAITSGTYGRQQSAFAIGGAFRSLMAALFATAPAQAGEAVSQRTREANEVRELARSVELQSPGFAADLYAAALRHESLND